MRKVHGTAVSIAEGVGTSWCAIGSTIWRGSWWECAPAAACCGCLAPRSSPGPSSSPRLPRRSDVKRAVRSANYARRPNVVVPVPAACARAVVACPVAGRAPAPASRGSPAVSRPEAVPDAFPQRVRRTPSVATRARSRALGAAFPAPPAVPTPSVSGSRRSGPSLNGTCAPAQRGTPCGPNGERRCDSGGACVRSCTVEGDCSQPPDTDVGFCRKAVCNDSACEEAAKEDGTVLPDRFQIPGDCKLRICVNNLPNGIGDDVRPDDIPGDAGPCFEGYCHDHVPSQRPRLAGHPCPNGTCNAQGSCV